MKYLLIFTLIVLYSINTASFAQTIILNGEQSKKKGSDTPVLTCVPVKITKTMKISEVKGNCNGFWIQKDSETIHKFKNLIDPVGTILKPGTYYVYPNLKKNKKNANISVTLKAQNST